MNAICAWCADCLAVSGQKVRGWCDVHRSEVRAEKPTGQYPFVCDHTHGRPR